jgi:hypothetical protein
MTHEEERPSRVILWIFGAVAVAATAIALVIVGFTGDSGGKQVSARPAAPPPAAPPAPTTVVEPPCRAAPSGVVAAITAAFTDGEQLNNVQAVNAPQDMTYVGGNITRGGEVLSHADVWLVQHGKIYALSSDARRRTLLPDGRDVASAGDEYGTAVQACVA